ncbi:MAG: polysaccharide biosynthesis C-terminal domain-containing protein [Ignavibacteriaceae bacterium]
MNPLRIIKSKVIGRAAIASLDQILISLTNFGLTILLLKFLPKVEFGYFNIILTAITFTTWVQNALITTPINVLLASKNLEEEKIFTSALFKGQIIFISIFSLFTILFSVIIYNLFYNNFILLIIAASSFAIIGILSRSYFRQLSYAQERPQRALKQDIFFTLFFAIFIVFAIIINTFNVITVIIGMGLCNIFVFTFYNLKENIKVKFNQIKAAYTETWQFGKWSLVGITVTYIQTYSYQYLIAILIGSIAVADNSASRLLMSPLSFILAGWGSIVRPRGSKLREKNLLDKFFKELIFVSIIITVIIIVYMIIIFITRDIIQSLLFKNKYQDSFEYTFYWGGIFIFQFIRSNASSGLQVIKKFKNLALINTFTMIITILTSYFLIIDYKIKGALIASIIGEIIFGGILWYSLYRYTKGKVRRNNRLFNFLFS